ncbi:hypothetical protein ZHAS_00002868 [Anopheles sinensis]|uniref:Uncharacterized protein n=1 Tax=Anopheles sinensis TaxID=74873 RepID=A0A084VD70_ANOSI|nr:hypothetical protein ZHAS_00002868 [Anopheles sinensis]
MALSRGFLLVFVLLVASLMGSTMAKEDTTKEVNKEIESSVVKKESLDVSAGENGARTLRAANPAPEPQQRQAPQVKPAAPAAKGQPEEPQFEQQILVVKGNPSQEKLNEEIRKALRSLLGPQGDEVQIRQLKDVDELRRVVPGAGPGPIGLKVVQ